jgi:lysophospholipase L1-like esterase
MRLTRRHTWLPNHWFRTEEAWGAGTRGTGTIAIGCPDDFHAMRLGFANAGPEEYVVPLMKACVSDAWGDYVNPVGGGRWVTFTTAHQGADTDDIVTAADAPAALTVAGARVDPASGSTNVPAWSWTDWVSIASGQPDPATNMRVVMIRHLALLGQPCCYANGLFEFYRGNLDYNNGYDYVIGGYNNCTDFVTNPAEMLADAILTNHMTNGSMIGAIQFLTRTPGVVGMNCGDSHHSGTGTYSHFNSYLAQSTTLLGQRNIGKMPFSFATCANGGARAIEYFAWLRNALPAIRPGFVVLPGWDYNTQDNGVHATQAVANALLAQLAAAAEFCTFNGTIPIFLTPFPRDAAAMGPEQLNAWLWLRTQILAMRATGSIVIDATAILGNQTGDGFDGTYKPEYTADNVHPNDLGHLKIAEQLMEVVESLTGLKVLDGGIGQHGCLR